MKPRSTINKQLVRSVLWYTIVCTLPALALCQDDTNTKPLTEKDLTEWQRSISDDAIKRYEPAKCKEKIKNFSFHRFYTRDDLDRVITFYLSKPHPSSKDQSLPLVVCIQGSGSQSVFMEYETPNGKMIVSGGPEAAVLRSSKEKVRVLVVEKPGVKFMVQPKRPGGSEEASDEFLREFSLDRWTEAINAAIHAARKLPMIAQDKMMVLGHSEGAQVACSVAAINRDVTHVAPMAGGGPTQLYDLIQFARSGDMYDPNASAKERVSALMADWKKVLADPKASDKFILGHTHLRWSSFLEKSPASEILKTNAKVFIAQGLKDTNSLPASAEMLYAELLARGRDCTFLRIEGGDHGFMTPGDNGKGWLETNKKAVDWFLNN